MTGAAPPPPVRSRKRGCLIALALLVAALAVCVWSAIPAGVETRAPGWLATGEPLVAAIEAYRAQHGGAPPLDLQELVPGHLAAVPTPRSIPSCHTLVYTVFAADGTRLAEQRLSATSSAVSPADLADPAEGAEASAYTLEFRYMIMRDSVQHLRYDSRATARTSGLPPGWSY